MSIIKVPCPVCVGVTCQYDISLSFIILQTKVRGSLKIPKAAVRCVTLGFEQNLESTPTANEMSGRVAVAAYIRPPTIDWYIVGSTVLLIPLWQTEL